MSLIPNYQLISLQEWEQVALSACFQTNPESKEKAQQFFYMFIQFPIINIFLDLIKNGSDTLLFVLFTCTSKNTDFFGKQVQEYITLIGNVMSWKLDGFTFVRPGKPPLQQYVTRTIMNALGVLAKDLYKTEQGQKVGHNFLFHLPNNYFKLYILRSFIQAVEVIDYQMGYMKYRSMIYNFQDNIIPSICEILMPFFYKIEQNIQVNQLSYLQQQLRVTQSVELQQQFNEKLFILTRQQQVQANYVFQLLKSVIQFNYNITYTDYQLQMTPQTNLITFPEKVLDKIVNGQFIKAYFFVLQHITTLIKMNTIIDYLHLGLNCLSKIMQSKLSNLEQTAKQLYIIECIKGFTKMHSICVKNGTKPIIQAFLNCHNKLLIGCQLFYIKNTIQKYFKNQQLYQTYIKYLTTLCVEIIKNESIVPENGLLYKALDTAFRILINFGYRDEENLEPQGAFFINFQQDIINNFLSNLSYQHRIFPSNCLNNIEQNKKILNQVLESFKRIAAYNYQSLFTKLQVRIQNYMTYMNQQLIFIANILFLLSEVVDKNFLQRTPFIHKATSTDLAILGRVIVKGTNLLKCYVNTKNVYFKKEGSYMDMAGIFYSEAIINQFLANFEGPNMIKIKYTLYSHMVYGKSQLQQRNFGGDTKSQETLLEYLKILLSFLQGCLIANKQDEAKMLYVLQAIQKSILKLKWNCKRQVYLKSEVFHVLEQFVTKFFNQFHFMVSIRICTAKMLVTLSFDDALDEYKLRICEFVNIVKSQSLISILYNLIGAFQGIQALVICKYFYNTLKKELNLKVLFDSIFQYAFENHNQTVFKDICKLIRVMVNNSGLKASNSNPISYEMLALVLPNLILVTNQIRKNITDLQFWHDSLCQILQMMNSILNGTHINICLMENLTEISKDNHNQILSSTMKQFLYSMLQLVIQIVPNQIKLYPRLQLRVLMFYTEINRELLSYIFGDKGENLVLQFKLFHFKLIDLAVQYMKELLSGIKTQEDSLIRSLQAARYFYVFAKRNSILINKITVLNNLQKVFSSFSNSDVNENKHQIFIFYFLSFILTNYKQQLSILRPIGKILYWLSKIFKKSVMNSLIKLKISEYMIGQIQDLIKSQDLSEDSFLDEFRHWVKRCDNY